MATDRDRIIQKTGYVKEQKDLNDLDRFTDIAFGPMNGGNHD